MHPGPAGTEPERMTASSPSFTLLVDGECPLCAKEAALLRRFDRGRGRLQLVDIASEDFDAARYGTTFEAVMGHIHGVLPDGRLVTGVEAFRRAYAAVGFGWVLAWTRWPGLRRLSDRAYEFFARNRLRFTGRRDACESGRCALPSAGQRG